MAIGHAIGDRLLEVRRDRLVGTLRGDRRRDTQRCKESRASAKVCIDDERREQLCLSRSPAIARARQLTSAFCCQPSLWHEASASARSRDPPEHPCYGGCPHQVRAHARKKSMLLSNGELCCHFCAFRKLFREKTELVAPSGAAPPDKANLPRWFIGE